MSKLQSIATGNFTSASTWGVCDPTGTATNLSGSDLLTTSGAGTRSSAFTPGAITISHLGISVARRHGTTGTISVRLVLSATNVEVAGTLCTINVADLPSVLDNAAIYGNGWIVFKLSTPVTLSAATAYKMEAFTSTSSMVTVYRHQNVVDDLARLIVTTTTAAPAAGDDFFIGGEYTGSGTSNSFTVTMNNTTTTDFGSAGSTYLGQSGISVSAKGTLTWGVVSGNNYKLKVSGRINISQDGVINMGTAISPCPRDVTMELIFDCSSEVEFGMFVLHGGTFNAYGLSRASGKNDTWCLLNTDEAVNSTSLGVDRDTGWLDNDVIVVAPTGTVYTEAEKGAMNGDAGASTLTVDGFAGAGGGIAYEHLGTDIYVAEIINLTRNITIHGASLTNTSFILVYQGSTVNAEWAEFYWLGSATYERRGIDIRVSTTSKYSIFRNCSFHDYHATGGIAIFYALQIQACTENGHEITGCVFYNNLLSPLVSYLSGGFTFNFTNTTGSLVAIDNCVIIAALVNSFGMACYAGNVSNVRISATGTAYSTSTNNYAFVVATMVFGGLTHENIIIHSCRSCAFYQVSIGAVNLTIKNSLVWRCLGPGLLSSGSIGVQNSNFVFDSIDIVGATGFYFFASSSWDQCFIRNCRVSGDAAFSPSYSFISYDAYYPHKGLVISDCDFSYVSSPRTAVTVADVYFNNAANDQDIYILFINCTFGAATRLSGLSAVFGSTTRFPLALSVASFVNPNSDGTITTYLRAGTISRNSATKRTGSYSMAMSPGYSTIKLASPIFFMPVLSGNSLTPSVYVYEDASYNGVRARLIVKANSAIGIDEDTVLDTATAASDAAWEQLTGATIVATADGVMEFFIDCDGTAGNLFVDDFTV